MQQKVIVEKDKTDRQQDNSSQVPPSHNTWPHMTLTTTVEPMQFMMIRLSASMERNGSWQRQRKLQDPEHK